MEKLRFICDNQLLTKWLRFLGFYTVLYSSEKMGEEYKDKRWFVFCSPRHYLQFPSDNKIFVDEYPLDKQLRIILSTIPEKLKIKPMTICSKCNTKLVAVDKNLIINKLPPMVKKNMNEFYQCPSCQQIYWKGTHFIRILNKLEKYI